MYENEDDEKEEREKGKIKVNEQELTRASLLSSKVKDCSLEMGKKQDPRIHLTETLEELMGRVQAAEAGLQRASEALVTETVDRERNPLKDKEVAAQWEDRIGAIVEKRSRQVPVERGEPTARSASVSSLGVAEAEGSREEKVEEGVEALEWSRGPELHVTQGLQQAIKKR